MKGQKTGFFYLDLDLQLGPTNSMLAELPLKAKLQFIMQTRRHLHRERRRRHTSSFPVATTAYKADEATAVKMPKLLQLRELAEPKYEYPQRQTDVPLSFQS